MKQHKRHLRVVSSDDFCLGKNYQIKNSAENEDRFAKFDYLIIAFFVLAIIFNAYEIFNYFN